MSALTKCDNNTTLRVDSLRMCIDTIILTKGDVNKAALISRHRRKVDRTTLRDSSRCSTLSHRNDLVVTTALVALNINRHGITEAKLSAHKQRNKRLKGLERAAMPANKHREIGRGDIENQLALVTLILINRRVIGIKMGEDRPDDGDGDIGDRVQLIIGKLDTGLIVSGDLRVLSDDLLSVDRRGVLDILFNKLISHNVLHS